MDRKSLINFTAWHKAGEQRRVLLCANTAWNLAHFRKPIILQLIVEGYEVHCAAPPDEAVLALQAMGCQFHPLQLPSHGLNPLADLALLYRLGRLLRQCKPHLFLSYTIKPNIYGSVACRSLRIPSIPNVSGLGTAFLAGGWLGRVIQSLYAFAFRSCTRVCFQNADDEALFLAHRLVRLDQVLALPGSGIDLQHFAECAMPSSGPVRFLFVGRLLKDKGLIEFASAAEAVKRVHPSVQFDVLGGEGGGNPSAISPRTLANWQQTGLLNLLGSAEDVRPFIDRSHCVVLPSYREGAPRSLIEAAAMGRPLIATHVPGCRDVVEDGKNGQLCAVKDASDLARAMLRFLDMSAEEQAAMGRASRVLAESRYDQAVVVRRVMDAVRNAVARGARDDG